MTTIGPCPGYLCASLLLIAIGCGSPAPVIEPVTHSILNPSEQALPLPATVEVVEPEVLLAQTVAIEVIEEEMPEEELPEEEMPEEEIPEEEIPEEEALPEVAVEEVTPEEEVIETQAPVETIATPAEKETVILENLDPEGVNKLTILDGDGAISVVVDESVEVFTFQVQIRARAPSMERVLELSDRVRIDIRTPDRGSPRVMVVEPIPRDGEVLIADLKVRIPPMADGRSLEMTIQDAGGNVSISNYVGKLKVVSLEGEVTIEDIVGDLTVAAGSGPCTISRTTGNVSVRDGAGALTISEVTGAVEIRDNGGPLAVRNISGDVVASNNSDGIEAMNVVGDLTLFGIDHTHSKIDGVEGRITYRTGSQ